MADKTARPSDRFKIGSARPLVGKELLEFQQRPRKRQHTATANFVRIGHPATFEMNDATDCASDE
jgi:hypothetical protein